MNHLIKESCDLKLLIVNFGDNDLLLRITCNGNDIVFSFLCLCTIMPVSNIMIS